MRSASGGVKVDDNSGTIVTGTQIDLPTTTMPSPAAQLSKEQIARQVAGYLRWLRARTESIELRGIERAGGAPVVLLPLETAYVPLRARCAPSAGGQCGPERAGSGRWRASRTEPGARAGQSPGDRRRTRVRQDHRAAAHGLGAGLFTARPASRSRRARASA